MGAVCRWVCKWWQNVVPRPPQPKARKECFAYMYSLLKWAPENGCEFKTVDNEHPRKHIPAAAASSGNVEMLDWLCKVGGDVDHRLVIKRAAQGGHPKLLRWAFSQGFQCRKCDLREAVKIAVKKGYIDTIACLVGEREWNNKRMTKKRKKAMKINHLGGYLEVAAGEGRTDVDGLSAFRFGRRNPKVFITKNELLACKAAWNGRLEAVKWLHQRECPTNASTMSCAARSGSIPLLEWLRSKKVKCSWDNDAAATVAFYGQLEALKWLRERKCPWDAMTTNNLAVRGEWEMLEWAVENDCDVQEDFLCAAIV